MLLESAVSYGLAGTALVTPGLLAYTPCQGWDLEMLLHHVSDSIETLNEAIAAGHIDPGDAQGYGAPEADAVSAIRRRAARLSGISLSVAWR
jgi:Mycothiol maleylpyruvate isomerase N-terminal domain